MSRDEFPHLLFELMVIVKTTGSDCAHPVPGTEEVVEGGPGDEGEVREEVNTGAV